MYIERPLQELKTEWTATAARGGGREVRMLRGLTAVLSGKAAHSTEPNCQCGCVPNIMSLHEQAKERARRREAAAARKPTLLEYLSQNGVPPGMASLRAEECATECEPEAPAGGPNGVVARTNAPDKT